MKFIEFIEFQWKFNEIGKKSAETYRNPMKTAKNLAEIYENLQKPNGI